MKRENDLRVKRTRESIKRAFIKLLNEKDYNDISITDISEEAMINRSTFYLHYKDKTELLIYLTKELQHEIINTLNELDDDRIDSLKKSVSTHPQVYVLLEYVEENSLLIKTIVHNNPDGNLFEIVLDSIINKYRQFHEDIHMFDSMYEYKKEIIICLSSTIISKWINDGFNLTKADLADFIAKTIRGAINEEYA